MTKCLDESNSTDFQKANEFLFETYQKQMIIDDKKKEKVFKNVFKK